MSLMGFLIAATRSRRSFSDCFVVYFKMYSDFLAGCGTRFFLGVIRGGRRPFHRPHRRSHSTGCGLRSAAIVAVVSCQLVNLVTSRCGWCVEKGARAVSMRSRVHCS